MKIQKQKDFIFQFVMEQNVTWDQILLIGANRPVITTGTTKITTSYTGKDLGL